MKSYLLQLASKYSLFQKMKYRYQSIRDSYYASRPIQDKLIVFEAFRSTKYADSPKAIYEYMINNPEYRDYTFIWVFENPENYPHLKNNRTKLVKHESHAHYMAFARAKYWVVNGWVPLRFFKKPGQVMVQCWHGTPLKRLRYDIIESANTVHRDASFRDNDIDVERYDYFISPSRFATKAFTSAFNLKALGKEGIITETGYPRNDFLINHTDDDVTLLRQKYNIPEGKKVILYAPTWRDDQTAQGGGYNYSLPVDFKKLQDELSGEYVLLFRAHNLIANSMNFDDYEGFIHDVSSVDDVNELYVVSDVLITDYSSVFFDYANLQRPIIFYMYDKEHYMSSLRGFYIDDLDELPGEIATTEVEVVSALGDLGSYTEKYKTRLQDFSKVYNYLDDGRSASRVTDVIL